MKGPIQSVEVSYLLHATEDREKVDSRVMELAMIAGAPEVEEVEGHFGNRILLVKFHLTGDEAGRAFERIVGKIPPAVKAGLMRDLGSHLDEHSAFFLRLDKQRLVEGALELGTRDPVRVKVKPRGFLIKGDAAGFYSRLLAPGG